MDDSCAVCADNLEWIAYGPCGHKDVCSTCVARLRFICDDRRCCICKTESSVVFVTKALGDYTRNIADFSSFPYEPKEGRMGSYWYHEDTQAFFDDSDQYKMIRAMCRLSCSVCDSIEQAADIPRKKGKFRNIEQLKGHLFHQHRLLMCSLCLEGRKVFICEQKLYTRAQLNQHVSTGDSDVDGTESERGGFTGHPMCEFCRVPFYGDNELYLHMSTEHYTCHLCQRQNPGQYEYYKNYDDLEIHFRGNHFLCEDESCLVKKFIVFISEAELKRHNALEHGGRMSRSKRNAALQIPTSFRYRRSNEQDGRRGRGRIFRRDAAEAELSMAIEASLDTGNSEGRPQDTSSSSHAEEADFDLLPISQQSGSELPSRYRQALSQQPSKTQLEESSFPPLPIAPTTQSGPSLKNNTMAARLRKPSNKTKTTPSASGRPSHDETWPVVSSVSEPSSSSSGQTKPAEENESWPAIRPSSSATPSVGSSRNWANTIRITHTPPPPPPPRVPSQTFDSSDFPPVSSQTQHKMPETGDIHTANKSLVERMRLALGFDQDKYTAFKEISGEYRQGLIDTETYLAYVDQFGLLHLVYELARLCPDIQKQNELIETYNLNFRHGETKDTKKGKGKHVDVREKLADSIMESFKNLQSSYKPSEEKVEVLLKDGYRSSSSKVKDQTVDQGHGRNKQKKKSSKFLRSRLGDEAVESQSSLKNSVSDPDLYSKEMPSGEESEGLPVRGVWRNGGGQKLLASSSRGSKK